VVYSRGAPQKKEKKLKLKRSSWTKTIFTACCLYGARLKSGDPRYGKLPARGQAFLLFVQVQAWFLVLFGTPAPLVYIR
jgi:hypothetical protein